LEIPISNTKPYTMSNRNDPLYAFQKNDSVYFQASNRFNIRPGKEWDGVDRSNGYESKVFQYIRNQETKEEENYRFRSQDM
jgi:hypothetical protein